MAEFRAILLERHGETVAPSIQALDLNRLQRWETRFEFIQ